MLAALARGRGRGGGRSVVVHVAGDVEGDVAELDQHGRGQLWVFVDEEVAAEAFAVVADRFLEVLHFGVVVGVEVELEVAVLGGGGGRSRGGALLGGDGGDTDDEEHHDCCEEKDTEGFHFFRNIESFLF